MFPKARPLLSTITGWPSALDHGSAMKRAVTFVVPPTGLGTINVIGLFGEDSCAIQIEVMPTNARTAKFFINQYFFISSRLFSITFIQKCQSGSGLDHEHKWH